MAKQTRFLSKQINPGCLGHCCWSILEQGGQQQHTGARGSRKGRTGAKKTEDQKFLVEKVPAFPLVGYCSVTQLCPILQPIDYSMPGLPVPYHLPEFAQVHVYCISGAIQPSHSLTPSSALSLSQHPGSFPVSRLFTSGDQNIVASASVLPMNIQG